MRTSRLRFLALLAAAPLLPTGSLAAQSVPGVDNIDWNRQNVTFTADALRAFNEVVARWSTALRDGDAKEAAEFYSLGATVAFSGTEMIRGKEGVARMLEARLAGGLDIRLSATDFVSSGDVMSATGPFVVESEDGVATTGTYSMMLRLERGRWRIRSQVFSPDIPLQSPVAADSVAEPSGR